MGTDVFVWMAVALLVVMVGKAVLVAALSISFHLRQPPLRKKRRRFPTVAVLVPAYNEEAGLEPCLRSLDEQVYPALEVIVVDDGSTDATPRVARELVARMRVPAQVISKPNGGKASALNAGLFATDAEIVVCVDADSVLEPGAVAAIIEPFDDPEVGAVGGIVKVGNRGGALGGQQAMEYLAGLSLQRAAFARVGAVQVLSGAISAFRSQALRAIGGYSDDTLVEDFDVTVAIQAAGYTATLRTDAVAHTEAPLSLRDLMRQRHRWAYGGFQVLAKYRSVLFTRKVGTLSWLGLPYFLLFPFVDVLVSLMLIATVWRAVTAGEVVELIAFSLALSMISLGLNGLALKLGGGHPSLLGWGAVQVVFFSHLLSWVTLRAALHFVSRRKASWHKLARAGRAAESLTVGRPATAEERPASTVIDLRTAPSEAGDATDGSSSGRTGSPVAP